MSESQAAERRRLDALFWGGVLIWAGLIFGADSMGFLPQIGDASAWSWIFLGAGLYGLILAVVCLASSDFSNPTASDYIWAGIFLIIGLAGFVGGFEIAPALILILIGIAILGDMLFRRS